MLDRLAQLIVDKLRPQLERIIDEYFKELKTDIHDALDDAYWESINKFNVAVSQTMPDIEKKLKKEITQQIVRGVKG